MSFGEQLKTARKACGMTQEALAAAVGVAKSTINGYEKGIREPDVLKIIKLAKTLTVSADFLLEIDFSTPISCNARMLALAYDRANAETQENAAFVLRKFLGRINQPPAPV